MTLWTLRRKIAGWVSPDLEKDAGRYYWLHSHIVRCRDYSGEVEPVRVVLQDLLDKNYNNGRALDDKARPTVLSNNMMEWREDLRNFTFNWLREKIVGAK